MRIWMTAAVAAIALAACEDKGKDANREAKLRVWGRDTPPAEAELKAAEQLDPTRLAEDPRMRERIIGMAFDEVVARMAFVEYHGLAKISVDRGRQRLAVIEDSLIRQGLHGSFQVLQRDENGDELRQAIYHNGVLYLSTSGGKMRVEGMVKDRHLTMREEAWQPLKIFAGYFGPRFGLEKVGTKDIDHRTTIEYKIRLADGPTIVAGTGEDTPKKPKKLSGRLWVDATTAVPIKGELEGQLDVEAGDGGEAGQITVGLELTLRTIEGEEIKPKSFIPTITRHPVDLDPLAFIDGGIRTSTVIGGPKKKTRTSTRGGAPR